MTSLSWWTEVVATEGVLHNLLLMVPLLTQQSTSYQGQAHQIHPGVLYVSCKGPAHCKTPVQHPHFQVPLWFSPYLPWKTGSSMAQEV